jgi:hypothetical protein
MANGWTEERRLRQSQLIKTWQPWKNSTGPKSEAGKAIASRNADQGLEWPALRTLRTVLKAQRAQCAEILDKTNNDFC